MILNVLCMIMCKKVPEGVVQFKLDELHKKIKFLPLPRSYGFDPVPGLSKQISEKGPTTGPSLIESYKSGPLATASKGATGEQALVRIMIKMRAMKKSEIDEEDRKLLKTHSKKGSVDSLQ